MKSHIRCIPCFLEQSVEALEMTGVDENVRKKTMKALLRYLEGADLDMSPPYLSMELHTIIREMTGVPDPYASAKRESTEMAQRLMPTIEELMKDSDDPLSLAVKIGAAGNVIDYGTFARMDLAETVDRAVRRDLDVWDMKHLGKDLEGAQNVLVLGDNAGEILLDTFLLGQFRDMGKDIIFAVRSGPIINDATIDDARDAGIEGYARIISGGSQSPGTLLEHATPGLVTALGKAALILAKGQGNFETLSRNPDIGKFARKNTPIYFLLTVKCPHVAEFAGVKEGSTIFRREVV